MTIDVHAHFVPEGYREALAAIGLSNPDGTPVPQWSPTAHLVEMDRLGISTAVLSLSSPGVVPFGSTAGEWARRVNDEAAAISTKHPNRFRFFASLPLPDVGGATAEAARAMNKLEQPELRYLPKPRGRIWGTKCWNL